MIVYYAHFNYDAAADDALYYGGSDSDLFTTEEEADKCGKYTLEHQSVWDCIDSYKVYSREIFDKFKPEEE